MLHQDYYLRIIQEFGKALADWLEKPGDDNKRLYDLKDLYRQYVAPYDDVRNLDFEEVLQFAHDQWKENERIERINFLAELLYAEANMNNSPLSLLLMERARKLFTFVETHGMTYSLDRQMKLRHIDQVLSQQ